MLIETYAPQSKLVTATTVVNQPKYPVVDGHNHLSNESGTGWDTKPIGQLLDRLDEAGIVQYIDLDGGWGEDILNRHLDHFKQPAPDRFKICGGVEWAKWADLGDAFPDCAARRLSVQKERGAEGLKIWKPLGLSVRDQHGVLVKVDDVRLSPIWQAAGELGLPITIHIADPVAFFDPIDETNERWEELGEHPDWAFTSPPFPPFLEIVNGLANIVARHPQTTFIGAHVGCYAENLQWVGELMDRCPNFYVDISARIAELGRQPYTARRFCLQHADRILFGTDMGPDLDIYRVYYRFLETADEYFPYHTTPLPDQGRWNIYGLYLPDEVLAQVYQQNAQRVYGLRE